MDKLPRQLGVGTNLEKVRALRVHRLGPGRQAPTGPGELAGEQGRGSHRGRRDVGWAVVLAKTGIARRGWRSMVASSVCRNTPSAHMPRPGCETAPWTRARGVSRFRVHLAAVWSVPISRRYGPDNTHCLGAFLLATTTSRPWSVLKADTSSSKAKTASIAPPPASWGAICHDRARAAPGVPAPESSIHPAAHWSRSTRGQKL